MCMPREPRFAFAEVNGITIHYAAAGNGDAPLLLCLHGFPEFWRAWGDVMPRLAGRYHVVAPDQRGYNLSSRPQAIGDYRTRTLANDMFALADRLSPDCPFILAGHDWGSAVAYAMAFARPERISRLVIANGVHPWCFQNAIINDPAQRAASQYMNRLCEADAEALLSANGFAKLFGMIEKFSAAPWLDDELRAEYRAAWSQPGALTGMLNWYRSSPVIVPGIGEAPGEAPVLALTPQTAGVRMAHLVVWGEDDTALTPACLDGLERFAPNLVIRRIAGATHWVLHEKPQEVADAMLDFLD